MFMKKVTTSTLIFTLLVSIFVGGVFAQKKASEITLLATGEFHGEEIKATSGERWLGLFATSDGFALLPAKLKVEMVRDEIVDENPNAKTGKKVSTNRASEPVFLLKGADFLRQGAVYAVFSDDQKYLGNGGIVNLNMSGQSYQLTVVNDDPTPGNNVLSNSKLIFSNGTESQVIFSVKEMNDGGWSLLWAGDLDGDGRLDLYMDLSNHYNASERRLFLSSQASGSNLVEEVAEFGTVGC
jgi:hypothetical protein